MPKLRSRTAHALGFVGGFGLGLAFTRYSGDRCIKAVPGGHLLIPAITRCLALAHRLDPNTSATGWYQGYHTRD